jgi:NAD(P)-dependent dehydrogenase (short-subunit alcohol dehydrogenase family)
VPSPHHSLAFVTGTSSGIGEALARELLGRGWRVVGAARRVAPITDSHYTHLQLDLGDLTRLANSLDAQLRPLVTDLAITRLGLVNNAAMEGLLGPISRLDPTAMLEVYTVNAAAPVLLMGWFQRHARPGQPLRIVNVSSGAAVAPFPGLGAYGNTKAALRMAGMILAAELDAAGSAGTSQPDTSILSFEPGLVDTPMQATARSSSAEMLPIVRVFRDFAATGALVAPALPARVIADYLSEDGHPRWEEQRLDPLPPGELDGCGGGSQRKTPNSKRPA